MTLTKKYILALMLGSVSLTSCINDFLDLEPLAEETEATYFKNLEQFQAAADKLHTDIYAWGGKTTYAIRHDYGTDLIAISSDAVNGTNSTSTTDTYYSTTYSRLRACNQLIEKAEAYGNKKEIAGPWGQALFFRAWHHFFLLQRFGGITLALKTPDVSTDIVWGPRNSRYEVIKAVLDDLDKAI